MTPPPPFQGFFFDANMPPRIARAMQVLDEKVVWIFDKTWYPDGDPGDHVWLPRVAEEGLVVITRDLDIIPNPTMVALYRKHNAGAFHLVGGHEKICDLIQYTVRQWPLLKQVARREERPFMLKVRPYGRRMDSLLGKQK